ncbi:hypothetical protein GW17_00048866 [Ensete ventricosum]|nr:hypothetical protein GW17_00048866 [Ensete ventricosum]
MKGRGRYNGKGERGESERDRVKKNGYLEKNKREPRITSEELCQFPYPYPLRSSSSSSEEEDNVTEMEGKGVWVGCGPVDFSHHQKRNRRRTSERTMEAATPQPVWTATGASASWTPSGAASSKR